MNARRRLTAMGLASVSALLLCSAPAGAVTGHGLRSSFNGADAPGGSFVSLYGASIDQSSNDVYVVDRGRERVSKFDAAGAYLAGSQLTGTPAGCTTACPITGPNVEFDPTDVAVDPTSGAVYVIDRGHEVIDKFSSSGELLLQFDGRTIPAPLPGSENTFAPRTGIAVDPLSGDVYLADETGVVDSFTATGAYVSQFAAANVTGLALSATGNAIYAAVGGQVQQFSPAGLPGPVIDSSGSAEAVAVDPSSGHVYVAEGSMIAEYEPSGTLVTRLFAASPLGTTGIAVGGASGEVYEPDTGGVVNVFGPVGQFAEVTTATPAMNVTPTTATLSGTVNPAGGLETQYHFEYGLDTSYATGSTTPGSAGSLTLAAPGMPVTGQASGLEPNTTYHYRLVASNSTGSNLGEDQTFTTLAASPAIDGSPTVSNITRASAAVHAALSLKNSDATYHVAYVDTADYDPVAADPYGLGAVTPGVHLGAQAGEASIAQLISVGLRPGTTYHYAFTVTNQTGSVRGPDATFTTSAATAPIALTGLVSAVGLNGATVTGTIDALGLPATFRFELGTSTAYGPPTGFTALDVSAGGPQTVSLSLLNLSAGTTYYYRLAASSQDGTSYGESRSFTTPGVAPLLIAPVAPALIATPGIAFPSGATPPSAPKTLTAAQKLSRALRSCKRKPKARGRRAACEQQARRRYKPAKN